MLDFYSIGFLFLFIYLFIYLVLNSEVWLFLCCSEYPQVRRLPRAHPGPLHPEGVGSHVARQVPQMQRMQWAAQRQVFRPQRSSFLQGGLLQVSTLHRSFIQFPVHSRDHMPMPVVEEVSSVSYSGHWITYLYIIHMWLGDLNLRPRFDGWSPFDTNWSEGPSTRTAASE